MPAPANLVHENSTSTGTSNFTLFAVNGRQRFSAAFGTGATLNVFDYFISSQATAEWERGTGHMSDLNTLVRDTVRESSNGGSAVNFSAGPKDVVNDIPAGPVAAVDQSAGDYTVTTETILLINKSIAAAHNINLPACASRKGIGIIIKDIAGNAASNIDHRSQWR